MRIAILSVFYPFRGGLSQFNANLYKELVLKKCEVKAFNFTTLYPNILFPGKTQYLEDSDPLIKENISDRVLSSINLITYRKTARLINNYQPDILIIPYWISFLAPVFAAVVSFLNKRIKVVCLVHNALPHERRFFDTVFAKLFFKKCDSFIAMSDFVEQDILTLVPSAKVTKIEHPISQQFIGTLSREIACRKLSIDPSKKNILFFGLIREYKGLDILIEAINFLDDTYQLIIAGESYVEFSKYQSSIDKSILKDNIKIFKNYISEDQVPLFFSASDLLVLPYRSATQSGVLSVAYQLEKPTLSTNVGSLGVSIKRANTGIVVDDVTPSSIAEGIRRFFNDPQQKDIYIENIKSEKKRLSWSSFTQHIIDFCADKDKNKLSLP